MLEKIISKSTLLKRFLNLCPRFAIGKQNQGCGWIPFTRYLLCFTGISSWNAQEYQTKGITFIVSHIVVPWWEMATAFFFFEIKPLRGCRLWASRPIFLGIRQVAVFPIGPKMKVTKSKNNWWQMIDHSKRRKKYQNII